MLEKVRKPLLEETARRKETNGWWLGVLDGSWAYPYKLQQQRTWERDYSTLPASEVAAAAARWMGTEPFVVISTPAPAPAGPAPAVTPAPASVAPPPVAPVGPPAAPAPLPTPAPRRRSSSPSRPTGRGGPPSR